MSDSHAKPIHNSLSEAGQTYSVGGDDPDFSPNERRTPLICAVPGLRRVLPQCRPTTA